MRSRDRTASVIAFGLIVFASLVATGKARAVVQCGEAAWYAPGGITASGEPNVAGALTAAHPNLPFGTKVSVRNLANGKSVVVRINDRGPFAGNRVIDLSRAAAEALDYIRDGVTRVEVTVLGNVAVKLRGACTSTDVASTSGGAADATVPPASGAPSVRPAPQPVSKASMSAQFGIAFQPDSWAEAELRKALEAFLPALRPR